MTFLLDTNVISELRKSAGAAGPRSVHGFPLGARRAGTRPERDAFIAATASEHGMPVVTRDDRDFALMGVRDRSLAAGIADTAGSLGYPVRGAYCSSTA
ncbi:DUF5615 family PIN-like protein [Nocardia jiangsuensis]|uniref:DUF5615 family PIN-like protein n=1 Tax=Nocardia jiangsuensis TaxID=1691563 RepID=A0ABV8DK61_9NOCA